MSDQTLEIITAERASAIIRSGDEDSARSAMEAAVRGGFKVIEFTLTTPGALELIREFSRRDGLVVGAGTVLDPSQVHQAVAAGARFIVSPVTDEAVIEAALEADAVPMPGANTPTELHRAWRAGAPLQKLFPAPAGGPAWLRACLGPMPDLRVVPTNGVDAVNARAWLAAGACALGFVASLFDPADLAAGRFDLIEERARGLLAEVRSAPIP